VAVGTPAYPAAVAVLPALARRRTQRLTNLLVTAEVTAFLLGPAIGGLIMALGRTEWSIWVAVGLAILGWPLLRGIGSGRAVVDTTRGVRGRLRAVLTSPGVPLAIAVVALVNFVESGLSLALISLNTERWGADERSFGIAIAGLGFGSLAAPLLILVSRLRGSLLVSGGAFAAAGLAPVVAAAVGPLAIAGAAGTAVECASTDVLQRSVPDRFRAFSLGLTDSIMVAAAMLGSLLLPQLSRGIGAPGAIVLSGFVVVGTAAFWRLRGRHPSPASVVVEERVGQ
jgi:MFS family permease